MADEDEDDKTESPSGRRLREAQDRGQIPIGKEVNAIAGFGVGTIALMMVGAPLRDSLLRLVAGSARGLADPQVGTLSPLLVRPFGLALAACLAAGIAGVIAYLFQTKGQIWPELAMPDLERVFGGGGRLQQIFSKQFWTNIAVAAVKVVTVGWAIWSCLRDEFMTLPLLLNAGPDAQLAMLFAPLTKGAVKVLTVMAIWAGVDIALTRYRHAKAMKMTKSEAKRDAREEDGDPMLRGKRKQKHRALLKGIARVEVPRADALIVNPTHIAIAIRYRTDESSAPRVTAKGKGVLAEMMRDLAREHGVPIVENIPLARLLYKRVKVGRNVPVETYRAVAAVLAYVYRVTGRQPSASPGGR